MPPAHGLVRAVAANRGALAMTCKLSVNVNGRFCFAGRAGVVGQESR